MRKQGADDTALAPIANQERYDADDSGRQMKEVRDAGVSDAVWEQLQQDRRKAEQEEQELARLAEEEKKLRDWLAKCEDARRRKELDEIERKRKVLEEQKRKEAVEKAKLHQKGVCPMGYTWIRQSGGYRCLGGSHFISDSHLSSMTT